MGVTGLWTVVQPCARPIKIETLNRKRLAVDASIWIYSFLKAVRDKEGNALRNSHVVGFYRRICKLLYIGIQPVFVFDGGAPALKRQTINSRKQRREGRREDAVRTAGKLLALQMQRRAEEEDRKAREAATRPADREEEEVPDDAVYVEEQLMTPQERQQKQKFKKTDQYHLPDLDVSLAEMGQPNDPRVMSLEELEHYARQFDSGEDINVYDFSKIDFNSPFFQSLPPSDRYNILNAARLRSRLRMGLSKDQLDTMFPDRMAFSRFQIDRVKERNELTQRLMNVNGMGDDPAFGINGTGRVAAEKGREYVLVKNAGVEGGWALGVIGDGEGGKDKPIDVDEMGKQAVNLDESESDEDDGFEDVPIEGLNRLPKISRVEQDDTQRHAMTNMAKDITKRRKALYRSRKAGASETFPMTTAQEKEDGDSLFIGSAQNVEGEDDDEAELQRAIEMSLENGGRVSSSEDNDYDEVFQESEKAPDQPLGNGDTFAATRADESDDESMEFENVLAAPQTSSKPSQPLQTTTTVASQSRSKEARPAAEPSKISSQKFDGPLPFEKLDLGSSILGKKKIKKLEEDHAGGFEKEVSREGKEKKSAPLPPWFSEDLKKGLEAQNDMERKDREEDRAADREAERDSFIFQDQPKLRRSKTPEVIDVDELEDKRDVIHVDSSEEEDNVEATHKTMENDVNEINKVEPPLIRDKSPVEELAPMFETEQDQSPPKGETNGEADDVEEEPYEWEDSDYEESAPKTVNKSPPEISKVVPSLPSNMAQRSPSIEFEDVDMTNGESRSVEDTSVVEFGSEAKDDEIDPEPEVEERPVPLLEESDDERYGSEAEDEELLNQLATEAEEHARFASTLNSRSQRQNIEDFERELKALQSQQKKDRRDADEVTQSMITECQQLLKLFGLPYVTAPMEAEAQCAELVSLGLVDGIVTDDSDIFLFGGTRIYKNMFNQAKFVECYLSSDLEREFDLTRDKMIRIAHLLGSDYTEGLPGIGPVTALEIISEFPGGLDEFKEWWTRVQTGARATAEDDASPFRRKFRRNSTKLFLPPAFPDKRVDQAYLTPDVDSDPSPFQWGVPDLDALRSFLMATVGWSPERTDEVLVPVIRDMNRRETEGTQANITRYIGGSSGGGSVGAGAGAGATAFAPRRNDVGKSKRMEKALEKLAERARVRRKAPAANAGSEKDAADRLDRAVQEDEVVIAMPGTTVGGRGSPRAASNQKPPGSGKRKAKSTSLYADQSDAEDNVSERPNAKQKKPKKRQNKNKT